MPSFQISITPSERAAGRFISRARRVIQRALTEEVDVTQADIARAIGVNRSVINREIRGMADITLGRVGQIAWALGRRAVLTFEKPASSFQISIKPTSGQSSVSFQPPHGRIDSSAKAS